MEKSTGDLYDLVQWIHQRMNHVIPTGEFELRDYAWWNNEIVNVPIMICQNQLKIFIPLESHWVTYAEAYFMEDLLETVLQLGFDKIKRIYQEHNRARLVLEDDKVSLCDLEKHIILPDNFSFFQDINGCKEHIEAWQITRTVSETVARVGNDNHIKSSSNSINAIFIKGMERYCIDDEYLTLLVPEKSSDSTSNYGWVPSSKAEVSFSVEYNEVLSEKIKNSYDPKRHYQYLLDSKKRAPNLSRDNQTFQHLISKNQQSLNN